MLGLALDHAARLDRGLAAGLRQLDHVRGRRQRGERVAQLVGEHGEELVLRAVGRLQRRLLALLQVAALAHRGRGGAQRVVQLHDLVDARRVGHAHVLALAHGLGGRGERGDRAAMRRAMYQPRSNASASAAAMPAPMPITVRLAAASTVAAGIAIPSTQPLSSK